MVKITSPTKGQQVPVYGNLTVSGTSVANSTSVFCYVSVIANGIKPYRMAVATGKGGTNDYSRIGLTGESLNGHGIKRVSLYDIIMLSIH